VFLLTLKSYLFKVNIVSIQQILKSKTRCLMGFFQFLSVEKQIFIYSYYINEVEPRSYLIFIIFIIFKMYYHNPMFQPVVHPQSAHFPVGQKFSSD